MTKWVKGRLVPALLELCQRLEHQYGMRMIVRGQGDNASPHVESKFMQLIAGEFTSRGWHWTTQPSNSPLCNVCDAALFPALAKQVSALGGLLHGGRYLHSEKLWEVLQQAWKEYPAEKIARTFVHHAQVAAAIYSCKGGDDFVKEHKGLSFGVRKVCRPYYGEDDDGEENTMDLTSLAPRQLSSAQGVIVEEVIEGVDVEAAKKLKYDTPDMQDHDIGKYLSYNELDLIAGSFEDVDYDNLTTQEKERYDKFGEAWQAKLESEGPAPLPSGHGIVI